MDDESGEIAKQSPYEIAMSAIRLVNDFRLNGKEIDFNTGTKVIEDLARARLQVANNSATVSEKVILLITSKLPTSALLTGVARISTQYKNLQGLTMAETLLSQVKARENLTPDQELIIKAMASTVDQEREELQKQSLDRGQPESFKTTDVRFNESMDHKKEIFGDKEYVVVKEGDGGKYSEVKIAKTTEGKTVAIKIARSDLDGGEKKDFVEEIDTLKSLEHYQEIHGFFEGSHCLTPTVIEQGVNANGLQYFVMNAAEGNPLDEIMRDNVDGYVNTPEVDVAKIAEQFSRVLIALHDGLHKSYYDYQPKNIYWDNESQRITVIDWNLLAPKVLYDGTFVDVDPNQDIYNFGKSLCRILGKKYIRDEATIPEIVAGASISNEMKGILWKAVNPDKTKRYRSATEMRNDLLRYLQTTKINS
jgi:hypothetical protein